MRKLINDPSDFVDEMLDGVVTAHPDQLRLVEGQPRVVVRADRPPGRVGIVTGGGSGHLPLFLGYVGRGLCSAAAIGNVFSSPSAEQVTAAMRAVDGGRGVLHLIGNYGGDVMNFALAADLAPDIEVQTSLGHDDVMSAPAAQADTRRGVAGLVLAFKCAGAAAERGETLTDVTRIAERTGEMTRTAGVGLSPTILPAAGQPTFELPEGQMEIGIGIHGEPGRYRGALETADEVSDRLLGAISADLPLGEGDQVVLLVNGLGATPLEELYLLHRRAQKALTDQGVGVHRSYVGEYATSLEMAGASITVMKLDDELAELVDAPASSPFFVQ